MKNEFEQIETIEHLKIKRYFEEMNKETKIKKIDGEDYNVCLDLGIEVLK